jgi:4-diphosphocytidyl-2-C-methyl-D-erythritol kinase
MTQLKAKAKINLFFHINGKRPDGYHIIESLVVFAEDIYDSIEITQAQNNLTEVIGGEYSHELINEKNNLIDKSLSSFTKENKYHCKLTKNIPVGAGIGGGSSDAAVVAKFLNKEDHDINDELAKIGADLPICYLQKPAFCTGIGEIITEVKNLPNLYLVMVNPRKPLLTKDVFKNNQIINTPIISNKTIDFSNNLNHIIDFLKPLNNDLSIAATNLMPEIEEILALLKKQNDCKISRMSGSGPTCFGIFTNKEQAELSCKNISILKPKYWVRCSKI